MLWKLLEEWRRAGQSGDSAAVQVLVKVAWAGVHMGWAVWLGLLLAHSHRTHRAAVVARRVPSVDSLLASGCAYERTARLEGRAEGNSHMAGLLLATTFMLALPGSEDAQWRPGGALVTH